MIAPGAKGIDEGVELEIGPPDERVTALVAATVRSSASSSWIPGTTRILLEDANESGLDSGGGCRLFDHHDSHRAGRASAQPGGNGGRSSRRQVRALSRKPD